MVGVKEAMEREAGGHTPLKKSEVGIKEGITTPTIDRLSADLLSISALYFCSSMLVVSNMFYV